MPHALVRNLARAGLAGALAIGPLAAQASTGKIQGVVRDSATGAAIADAKIQILGSTWTAITDSSGYFFINGVLAGRHDVRATIPGYRGVEVRGFRIRSGFTETLDFGLVPRPDPLADLPPAPRREPQSRPPIGGRSTEVPAPPGGDGNGRIAGVVRDSRATPIVGSAVRIVGTDYHVVTDSTGAFVFEKIPIGRYDVRVEAASFRPVQVEGVRVLSRLTVTQDFTLERR